MADSIPYRKPHFPVSDPRPEPHRNPIRHGKSYTMHFLLKALTLAVFIVLLPLFPSQAPEFINHTILTKFWELIHVIVVGIAVSYGLFSRRNSAEMGIENSSNVGSSDSYVPRFFPVSSSFEGECEQAFGYGEKREGQSWNSGYFVGNPVAAVSESCHESNVFDAQCKPSLGICESGGENSCGYGEKNVTQAWNSRYFQGESMVFVAEPNYGLDEWGKPRSIADNQPLGLPVRSLKSRVKSHDSSEFVARGEFSLGSKGSFNSSDGVRNGDMGPLNLEDKLNEAAASPSPVNWRSGSGKMERGKRVGGNARPSHLRPLSVDETQFESMKTPSFQSALSFTSESSSQTSSLSSSPKEDSSALSMSSEVLNSKSEKVKKRKSSHSQGSSSPSGFASSPPKPMNEKASLSALHSRGYSIGSFHEEDLRRSSENYLKDLSGSRSGSGSGRASGSGRGSRRGSGSGSGSGSEEEQLKSKELGHGFLGLNTKPASLGKSSENYLKDLSGSRSGSGSEEEQLNSKDLGQGFLGLNTKPASLSKSSENYLKDLSGSRSRSGSEEEQLKSKDLGQGFLGLNTKPASLSKSSENYLKDLSGSRSGSRSGSGRGSRSGSEEEQLKSKELGHGFLGLNTKPASLSKSSENYLKDLSGSRSRSGSEEEQLKSKDLGQGFLGLNTKPASLSKSSENYLKDLSGSRSGSRSGSGRGSRSGSEEEQLKSKELGQGFLGLNTKPASLTKSSSRGKSVRTIRGSRLTTPEKVEKMRDIGDFIPMRKETMQNGGTNVKDLGTATTKLDFGNPLQPKPEIPKHGKKQMREFRGNAAAESEEEEDLESEAENFQVSSDDEGEDDALAAAAAATCSNSVDVGAADSEVDKKAGEFIAKFREQIRLQKVASMDRSRAQHISANSFR
ncbi:uncharacterized protein LOC126613858 isoform X2 [Malus sylvestris]|uniref:uncharacterized protein LOC126613858 isoform X2 n=1 Tax=Malus sylvestris TaxID=3752 RepID=UPI0021AD1B8A|nr:uncharacterized protein LOC126613858 isoform X2 [Malus sylvestris]